MANDAAVGSDGDDRAHAAIAQRRGDVAGLVEQGIFVRVAVAAVHAAHEAERIAALHRTHLERLDLGVGGHGCVLVEHLLAAEIRLERLEPQRALREIAVLAASADVKLVDEAERPEPS